MAILKGFPPCNRVSSIIRIRPEDMVSYAVDYPISDDLVEIPKNEITTPRHDLVFKTKIEKPQLSETEKAILEYYIQQNLDLIVENVRWGSNQ